MFNYLHTYFFLWIKDNHEWLYLMLSLGNVLRPIRNIRNKYTQGLPVWSQPQHNGICSNNFCFMSVVREKEKLTCHPTGRCWRSTGQIMGHKRDVGKHTKYMGRQAARHMGRCARDVGRRIERSISGTASTIKRTAVPCSDLED